MEKNVLFDWINYRVALHTQTQNLHTQNAHRHTHRMHTHTHTSVYTQNVYGSFNLMYEM